MKHNMLYIYICVPIHVIYIWHVYICAIMYGFDSVFTENDPHVWVSGSLACRMSIQCHDLFLPQIMISTSKG